MKITKADVVNVANLSRLNLSENEIEKLTVDMDNILSYVDKLNELDTSGIVPTAHVIPITNVFRTDVVEQSYDASEILNNAPVQENGCFKVPNIVE